MEEEEEEEEEEEAEVAAAAIGAIEVDITMITEEADKVGIGKGSRIMCRWRRICRSRSILAHHLQCRSSELCHLDLDSSVE
jgi:hypothetical protein